MSNSTIDYYNDHAKEYFEATVHADMSSICDKFLDYIQPGGKILDVGCGSGRDLRYFKEAGYSVEGIDLSPELCKMAAAYSGAKVVCADLRTWRPTEKYDGIWANASLLHLHREEVETVILHLPEYLKIDGIAFISMKDGIETGEDENGRYSLNFSENMIRSIISKDLAIRMEECWYTCDELQRSGFRWVNIVLRIIESS